MIDLVKAREKAALAGGYILDALFYMREDGAPVPPPPPPPTTTPQPPAPPAGLYTYSTPGPLVPHQVIRLVGAPSTVSYFRLAYKMSIGMLNREPLSVSPLHPARYKLGYDRTPGAWIYDSEIQVVKGNLIFITDLDQRVFYDAGSLDGRTYVIEIEKRDAALVVTVNGQHAGLAAAQQIRTGLTHDLTWGAAPSDVRNRRSWPSDPITISEISVEMR